MPISKGLRSLTSLEEKGSCEKTQGYDTLYDKLTIVLWEAFGFSWSDLSPKKYKKYVLKLWKRLAGYNWAMPKKPTTSFSEDSVFPDSVSSKESSICGNVAHWDLSTCAAMVIKMSTCIQDSDWYVTVWPISEIWRPDSMVNSDFNPFTALSKSFGKPT